MLLSSMDSVSCECCRLAIHSPLNLLYTYLNLNSVYPSLSKVNTVLPCTKIWCVTFITILYRQNQNWKHNVGKFMGIWSSTGSGDRTATIYCSASSFKVQSSHNHYNVKLGHFVYDNKMGTCNTYPNPRIHSCIDIKGRHGAHLL